MLKLSEKALSTVVGGWGSKKVTVYANTLKFIVIDNTLKDGSNMLFNVNQANGDIKIISPSS